MSGHSKWSTIKRQKGVADAKRGQLFTKLSKAITLAVKQGGGIGDPALNFRLRLAIEAARASNMPKDNIERAIAKAAGGTETDMQEVLYEGFGPGGFSAIVEAVTDNKLRTNSEVKNLFEKNGGTFGNPGSVGYQFQQKGFIVVDRGDTTVDDIFMLAADAGADDIEEIDGEVYIYTKPDELAKVRGALHENSLQVKEAKLVRKPIMLMTLPSEEHAEKALSFITLLEDHPDVQDVFTNFDIPDSIVAQS